MYSHHSHQQKTAGIIRYSCALLFMLFSFCYLFFLQGDVLAEAQYVYSHGITTYNIFVGAAIITLVLQILQWIVGLLSRLPARWHALSYLPSMLLLAILTGADNEVVSHFSLGGWIWVAPLLLCIYVLAVIVIRTLDRQFDDPDFDIKSQVYPNFIILFLLILGVGFAPHSSDVYHYELKTERLLLEGDYEEASAVGERSLATSARLTQLRMYALSQQGLLAERLFDYPQHYGSRGLLDVTDTLSSHRLSTSVICHHLGAYCGSSIHSTDRYYQLMLADTIWNAHTVDYYLCSLLLDKKLAEFRRQLPRYYNLSDTIASAYDRLPRAYREALLQMGNPTYAIQGKIVLGADTLATLSDYEMVARFRDYRELKATLTDKTERINRTHRDFGNTYWWYYEYEAQRGSLSD